MEMQFLQPGIDVRNLYSSILNQDLQISIKLPWTYDRSTNTYPVLYALDANRSFPIFATQSLIYETPGTDTREILIVGVGYQVDRERIKGLAQWAAWRTRDLTPGNRMEVDQFWGEKLSRLMGGEALEVKSGGAAKFLESLQAEVIPFIEANYRCSELDRGLAGFSYGGLFVLYTLFHSPELFTRYFAGSPSMWHQLFADEEKYAAGHADLRAKLFVTGGSYETDTLELLFRLTDRLRARGYPGLEIIDHVFEGCGHASSYAAAISWALAVLYCEDWLKS